ncbi:hypothetical protein J6590_043719 [Homalodisca vitripennis]|nr:hypothetical protein J6590_043719 [Homalodisca vitripennis]
MVRPRNGDGAVRVTASSIKLRAQHVEPLRVAPSQCNKAISRLQLQCYTNSNYTIRPRNGDGAVRVTASSIKLRAQYVEPLRVAPSQCNKAISRLQLQCYTNSNYTIRPRNGDGAVRVTASSIKLRAQYVEPLRVAPSQCNKAI